MNYRSTQYFKLLIATSISVFAFHVTVHAEEIRLIPKWSSSSSEPNIILLEPTVFINGKDSGAYAGPRPPIDTAHTKAIANPKLISVIAVKDNKPYPVEITKIEAKSSPIAANLRIVLPKAPDKNMHYLVTIPVGSVAYVSPLPSGVTVGDTHQPLEIKGDIQVHNDFLTSTQSTNKAALRQGSKSGTIDFSYLLQYPLGDPIAPTGAVHASIDANASFNAAERHRYFDKIEAELGAYAVHVFGENSTNNAIVEYGLSSKLQADQQFDKIDQTLGVNTWIYPNADPFPWIYRNVCLFGEKPDFALPPRIIFGYDYVFHENNDAVTTSFDGNQRLSGRFDWTLPIAHHLAIKDVPIVDSIREIELVTDISGIYDINKGKAAPEIHLSLDFVLSDSDKSPTISFSYINGKSAPKFENVDAFLAGFKLKF